MTITVRGPVDITATDFVRRHLDDETITALLRSEFVVVTGARQTGKTTLANSVRSALAERSVGTSYIDVSPWEGCVVESEWLALFVQEMRNHLSPTELARLLPPAPATFAQLPQFVVTFASAAGKPLVLVLDEISGVPQPLRQPFFASLRVLFNERSVPGANKAASSVAILFLGAIDLLSFVPSGENSPFNVAKELDTVDFDFDRDQIAELCGRLKRPDITEDLHRRANGHPYLTKRLIELADETASIAEAEDNLWLHSDSNLTYVRRRVDAEDAAARGLLGSICAGQRVRHVPSASMSLSRLISLGVVRRTHDGYCDIRCELYRRLLCESHSGDPQHQAVQQAIPEAVSTVMSFPEIALRRYTVIGNYARHDEPTRHRLKDLVDAVASECRNRQPGHQNYLIWAPPGTGKTYFVDQLHRAVSAARYFELNLVKDDRLGVEKTTGLVESEPSKPTLCFVDEVDALSAKQWAADSLLPLLDLNHGGASWCTVLLAGSHGTTIEDLERRLREWPKGEDLLSRIPGRLSIPPLTPADQLVVAAAQLLGYREGERSRVQEIERLALVYMLANVNLRSSRRLADFCAAAVGRMGEGHNRLRYDHLFEDGNPENKSFWMETIQHHGDLVDRFILLEGE